MTSAARRTSAVIALTSAALAVVACGGGATSTTRTSAAAKTVPVRILHAPKNLESVTEPQSNGIMWALAGNQSEALYEIDATTGHVAGIVPVSRAATAVAESTLGVIGLALGTNRSGALELLDGRTSRRIETVALPAPARDVALGSDGSTFYVLTGWPKSASVTIVDSQNGKVQGTIPMPSDAVSIEPDVQQAMLYVLERSGEITEISISDGKIASKFSVGHDPGLSLALSPDGGTLYVLKGTDTVANIAVVSAATQSVLRVLPAPSHCLQVLASTSGTQLYEAVGTPAYGNIQVFVV